MAGSVDWRPLPETLARLTVPLGLWVVRAYVDRQCSGSSCALLLAFDVLLIITHWWANLPMARVNGGLIGAGNSVTKGFFVPIVLAALLLILNAKDLVLGQR
jgi:hypothetical protein